MGLCKCPKRRVTQHFCFEHKVNVCEFCMIHDHQKCIVHPYLQWLEDSSFQPNCTLCKGDLASDDCVRLLCYHIFHWNCLNNYAQGLPQNTAPAGYTCPDCQKTIFPPSNSTTPISQFLRKVLAGAEWARIGLGLPILDKQNMSISELGEEQSQLNSIPHVVHNNTNHASGSIPVTINNVSNFISSGELSNQATSRKAYEMERKSDDSRPLIDIDDNKYKRKSPMEFLTRWFRSRTSRRGMPALTYRRWIILVVILLIGFFTVLHYFMKYGRENADNDLSLDPAFNPHIRVEEN